MRERIYVARGLQMITGTTTFNTHQRSSCSIKISKNKKRFVDLISSIKYGSFTMASFGVWSPSGDIQIQLRWCHDVNDAAPNNALSAVKLVHLTSILSGQLVYKFKNMQKLTILAVAAWKFTVWNWAAIIKTTEFSYLFVFPCISAPAIVEN